MRKLDHRFENPDAFDEHGILKDGAVARISMTMRDGIDRPLTHDEMMIRLIEHDAKRRRSLHVDAADPAPFALNRPGFRHLVAADGDRQQQATIDAARQRVLDARAEYIRDLEGAWQTPQPATNTGAQEFSSEPQEGAPCTRDGYPGVWQDDGDGGMVCVINRQDTGDSSNKTLQQLQLDHRNTMSEVYRQHEAWLQNQWRSK